MLGELARSSEGCDYLEAKNVLSSLVSKLKNESTDVGTRRAVLWSIGNIGSSFYGCKALLTVDDQIVSYIITLITTNCNFSIRGAAFFALGLISKSPYGSQLLIKYGWETSPNKGAAVALPLNPSVLFRYNREVDDPLSPRPRTEEMGLFRSLHPFLFSGKESLDIEVMSNISKVQITKYFLLQP